MSQGPGESGAGERRQSGGGAGGERSVERKAAGSRGGARPGGAADRHRVSCETGVLRVRGNHEHEERNGEDFLDVVNRISRAKKHNI